MLPAYFPKHWVLMWTLWKLQKSQKVNCLPSSIFPLKPCNPSHHYSNHIIEPRVSLLLLVTSKTLLLLWSLATLCPFQIALIRSTVCGFLWPFWDKEKKNERDEEREGERECKCGDKTVIGKKKRRTVLWWQYCGNFFKIKQWCKTTLGFRKRKAFGISLYIS